MKILLVVIVAFVALLLIILFFHYNNVEVSLRKAAGAQEKNIAAIHDAMWKIIKEKAGVAEKYRETFERIYPELISGRYKSDSAGAMKWIKESNPDFDTALYSDLMTAIESQRILFQRAQQKMLDIIRERDTLLNKMPDKFFIMNKEPISSEVIVSDHTRDVMETRTDNELLQL